MKSLSWWVKAKNGGDHDIDAMPVAMPGRCELIGYPSGPPALELVANTSLRVKVLLPFHVETTSIMARRLSGGRRRKGPPTPSGGISDETAPVILRTPMDLKIASADRLVSRSLSVLLAHFAAAG